MMSSKLPTATLGKVWDLSDIDRDGFLDRYEFTVAMHLVFRALQVKLGSTMLYLLISYNKCFFTFVCET